MKSFLILAGILVTGYFLTTCQQRNKSTMNTFGKDLNFLKQHVAVITLSDSSQRASVAIVPAWQGRVMTSTATGQNGFSYGWINYKLIESGIPTPHINAYGGEERIWLGPEGGPFSIYFAHGSSQEFANWQVPPPLDTEPFEVVSTNQVQVEMKRTFSLTNYSGTKFDLTLERKIKLLSVEDISQTLGVKPGEDVHNVGYESSNRIINAGNAPWKPETGLLSIWMLSMFTPSPGVTAFIPYREGPDSILGKVVTDDYFGKVPPDRLKVEPGIIYFRIDGKYRSKIGISPLRAKLFCGSYDAENKTLTILWFNLPEKPGKYVNSKWGQQDDPYQGDAVNSYNDGPTEDGSQMGPFYELESSSPAAELKTGESMEHIQRIFHFEGNEPDLSRITSALFGKTIQEIEGIFR